MIEILSSLCKRERDLSPESLDGRFCGGVEARRQIPSLASDDLWDVRVRESECMTELRERYRDRRCKCVVGMRRKTRRIIRKDF